nr:splicing factor, suppressor of white-apricot homolog isoform X1 [Ipomoea batatas]
MDFRNEVVGRHALFFDDDAMAAFVNSADARSLKIDRYESLIWNVILISHRLPMNQVDHRWEGVTWKCFGFPLARLNTQAGILLLVFSRHVSIYIIHNCMVLFHAIYKIKKPILVKKLRSVNGVK